MANVLIDATTAQLGQAIEENIRDMIHAMTRLLESEIVERSDISYHFMFPSNPVFKGVWGARLTAEHADAVIEETLTWFKARNAPSVLWWVTPEARPADLSSRLIAHGFKIDGEGDPGMAVELSELYEDVPLPAGLEIVMVQTEQHVRDWGATYAAAFGTSPSSGQGWVDATLTIGVNGSPWKLYLGYLNDRPVAKSFLFCGGGVASVYGVGTIPMARGRGIGAQITLKPFLDARTQGYRYGVLFSKEMGHPVYERLGFRDVGIQFGRYLWRNN